MSLFRKQIRNLKYLKKDIRRKKRENLREKRSKEGKLRIKRTKNKNSFVFKMLLNTFKMSI